jgi:hypothetical protein
MNFKKAVYYSHPRTHYDTDLEWECINLIITALTPIGHDNSDGYIDVMNPNQKWLSKLYQKRKESGDNDPFEIFREIVRSCDIIVGTTFKDGTIGAGVAEECKVAQENKIDCYLIYLDYGKKLFMPFIGTEDYYIRTIEDTREKTRRGEM